MTIFNQHLPSNEKTMTDDYLTHPSQFTYEENRETIANKKVTNEYIEIFDSDISKVRGEFDKERGKGYNELTIGDAVSLILAKEFREGYTGLIDPNEEEIMGLQEVVDTKPKKKVIEEAYRDFDNCSTVYFLK